MACNILKKSSANYTSHTWRRSAATNLADANVSLINLKRHGQWVSDSVVEGYIANSRPLREERLRCLLPEVEREKLKQEKEVGQQLIDVMEKKSFVENNEASMVELSNLPEKNGTQTDLTLYGFSQFYEPASDFDIQPKKQKKDADVTEITPAKEEAPSNSETSPLEKFFSTSSTFNNCTFVFNMNKWKLCWC